MRGLFDKYGKFCYFFFGRTLKGAHGGGGPTHTFHSQLAARPQKGQKRRGRLVFSQLIRRSGPRTASLSVPIMRAGRDEGGGVGPRLRAPSHSPPHGPGTQMDRAPLPWRRALPAMGAVCPVTHPELM